MGISFESRPPCTLRWLRRMWSKDAEEANARRAVATSVTFGEEWDVPVRDLDADPKGNGFSFTTYEAAAFSDAIGRALHRYKAGDPWRQLRTRAMRADHSWTASAKRYVEMYTAAAKARRAA